MTKPLPARPAPGSRVLAGRVAVAAAVVALGGGFAPVDVISPPTRSIPQDRRPILRASADSVGRSDSMITVPFVLFNGWILVSAEVDGRRGMLIVDTGDPVVRLNRRYVQPNQAGGLDTATGTPPAQFRELYNVRSLRLGTLTAQLQPEDRGPPTPKVSTNAIVHSYYKFEQFERTGHPLLGLFGLSAMEPFETIIDYPNQQLVLIKLDSAGRRLVGAPAYTPAMTVPLVPVADADGGQYWWGIEADVGGERDTFEIDTGAPCNNLVGAAHDKYAARLTSTADRCTFLNGEELLSLDQMVIGGRTFEGMPFAVNVDNSNDLNYPFLRHLGVVGFNFRTRQFMAYR